MLKAMDILGIDKKNIEEYFFRNNNSIFRNENQERNKCDDDVE